MSSITMAADSTQSDLKIDVVGRSKPKKKKKKEDSEKRKKKDRSKKNVGSTEAKKKTRGDSESDCESDLDLSKELKPIGAYIGDREETVGHLFRSISNKKMRAMLPEILKPIPVDDLKRLCLEQLECMSKKRIKRILQGADPETISSSGTDDEDLSTDYERPRGGSSEDESKLDNEVDSTSHGSGGTDKVEGNIVSTGEAVIQSQSRTLSERSENPCPSPQEWSRSPSRSRSRSRSWSKNRSRSMSRSSQGSRDRRSSWGSSYRYHGSGSYSDASSRQGSYSSLSQDLSPSADDDSVTEEEVIEEVVVEEIYLDEEQDLEEALRTGMYTRTSVDESGEISQNKVSTEDRGRKKDVSLAIDGVTEAKEERSHESKSLTSEKMGNDKGIDSNSAGTGRSKIKENQTEKTMKPKIQMNDKTFCKEQKVTVGEDRNNSTLSSGGMEDTGDAQDGLDAEDAQDTGNSRDKGHAMDVEDAQDTGNGRAVGDVMDAEDAEHKRDAELAGDTKSVVKMETEKEPLFCNNPASQVLTKATSEVGKETTVSETDVCCIDNVSETPTGNDTETQEETYEGSKLVDSTIKMSSDKGLRTDTIPSGEGKEVLDFEITECSAKNVNSPAVEAYTEQVEEATQACEEVRIEADTEVTKEEVKEAATEAAIGDGDEELEEGEIADSSSEDQIPMEDPQSDGSYSNAWEFPKSSHGKQKAKGEKKKKKKRTVKVVKRIIKVVRRRAPEGEEEVGREIVGETVKRTEDAVKPDENIPKKVKTQESKSRTPETKKTTKQAKDETIEEKALNKMAILELEMRARAIKAMLRKQEEQEQREQSQTKSKRIKLKRN